MTSLPKPAHDQTLCILSTLAYIKGTRTKFKSQRIMLAIIGIRKVFVSISNICRFPTPYDDVTAKMGLRSFEHPTPLGLQD